MYVYMIAWLNENLSSINFKLHTVPTLNSAHDYCFSNWKVNVKGQRLSSAKNAIWHLEVNLQMIT